MNAIREARDARGWSSDKLNAEMREAARMIGVSTATQGSLRVMISMWENDKRQPDPNNQLLLQRVFGLPPEALGFAAAEEPKPVGEELAPLVKRGTDRIRVTDGILGYFERQLAEHVVLDNSTGPGFVLDVVGAQVKQLRTIAANGPDHAVGLAARFIEHAGWLHQDSGELDRALRYSDEAVDLAERSGNLGLTAYNLMRKSNVLTTANEYQRAAVTAQRALSLAERSAPEQRVVCLRQVALSEAYLRNEKGARSALDRALNLADAPALAENSFSGYCTAPYLEMENALLLFVLGNPAQSAAASKRALEIWPESLPRDEAVCLVRLACAQLDLHQVEEACSTAMMAIQRVQEAPSARTLHMLRVVSRRVHPYREVRSVRQLRDALALVA